MQGDSRLKYFYEPFKGKSNAVRRAFLELNSEYFLLADADLTYPASEAKKLIDVMNQNGSDMFLATVYRAVIMTMKIKDCFIVLVIGLCGFCCEHFLEYIQRIRSVGTDCLVRDLLKHTQFWLQVLSWRLI